MPRDWRTEVAPLPAGPASELNWTEASGKVYAVRLAGRIHDPRVVAAVQDAARVTPAETTAE